MPELPEVQTIVNDLKKEIIGYRIVDVKTDTPKMIKPSVSKVLEMVKSEIIKDISRRGKMIVIQVKSQKSKVKSFLLIHLKLTGRLLVRRPGDSGDEWVRVMVKLSKKQKNTAPAMLRLRSGQEKTKKQKEIKELRFADLRKFGYIKLIKSKKELQRLLEDLGPEPQEIFPQEFYSFINSRKKAIKQILMDQKIIAGVGNIYANEALFWAGIDPQRSGKSLTKKEAEKLHQAVIKVLNQGLKYRGASAKDDFYRDAYGEQGKMQYHLAVYQREGERCVKCGLIIRRIKIGGRGTFYCEKCQK